MSEEGEYTKKVIKTAGGFYVNVPKPIAEFINLQPGDIVSVRIKKRNAFKEFSSSHANKGDIVQPGYTLVPNFCGGVACA